MLMQFLVDLDVFLGCHSYIIPKMKYCMCLFEVDASHRI